MPISNEDIHKLTMDALYNLKHKESINEWDWWDAVEVQVMNILCCDEDDEQLDDAFGVFEEFVRDLQQKHYLIYRNSAREFKFTDLSFFWRSHLYDVAQNKPWYRQMVNL